jgi:hypothetical protein
MKTVDVPSLSKWVVLKQPLPVETNSIFSLLLLTFWTDALRNAFFSLRKRRWNINCEKAVYETGRRMCTVLM